MSSKVILLLSLTACFIGGISGLERGSSLRSALEALQRRQRAQQHHKTPIDEYDEQAQGFDFAGPPIDSESKYNIDDDSDDADSNYIVGVGTINVEKLPQLYYTDKNDNDDMTSRKSPFRERNAHKNVNKLKTVETKLREKQGGLEEKNDEEYAALLEKLWLKYKFENKDESPSEKVYRLYSEGKIKRDPIVWGPVAFKKKRRSSTKSGESWTPEDYFKYSNAPLESRNRDVDYGSDIDSIEDPDIREEYAIAFQPLDSDPLTETMSNSDEIKFMEKRFKIKKRSSGPMPANLAKLSGSNEKDIVERLNSESERKTIIPGDIMIPNSKHEHHEEFVDPKENRNTTFPMDAEKDFATTANISAKDKTKDEYQKPINIEKKSIDWSKYFGIDKRSDKSFNVENQLRRRYLFNFLNNSPKHAKSKRSFILNNPLKNSESMKDNTSKKTIEQHKRSEEPKQLHKFENIDENIKSIEGSLVDDALTLTEEDTSAVDTVEERQLKEETLSRLAAAYSLEKMRSALKELKQNLKTNEQSNKDYKKISNIDKRVSVKKEKVELKPEEILPSKPPVTQMNFQENHGQKIEDNPQEPISEGYSGAGYQMKTATGEARNDIPGNCPILENIVRQCRGIDILAGDREQQFLPVCILHQICYLCGGSSPTSCDLNFLSEANAICEGNVLCQQSARATLKAMSQIHELQIDALDGECSANSCLASALRLNSNWRYNKYIN